MLVNAAQSYCRGMITPSDYDARGWHVRPLFTEAILDPDILAEMGRHPESRGESSWGTRNVLAAFVLSMRPKLFLEIGSHIGSGAVVVGAAMKANGFGRMVCLEPADHYHAILSHFIERAGVKDHVTPLKAFSTDPALPTLLGDKPDMVFIDANHSYSHAMRDIEIAANLLAPGGLIFLDDVGEPFSGEICEEGKGGVRGALLDFTRRRQDFSVVFFEPPFWLNPGGLALMARAPGRPKSTPKDWISVAPSSLAR